MLLVPAPACSTVTHLFSGGGSTLAGQAEGTPVLPAEGQGPDKDSPPVPGGDTPTPERQRAAGGIVSRRTLLLMLLAALFTGCTRSLTDVGNSGTLPEQIAQTLTAAPSLAPTRTPPPSATPQPTATTEPPPSPTITTTPTVGPSPTPTPPALPEGDPRQGINLAVPDLTDDFSVRYGWFEYNDANAATISWERGQLSATDHGADGFLWWSTSGQTADDLFAEITATAGECQAKDAYGLAVRIGGISYDRGYTLEFSCDGHYRMRRFISGQSPELLLDWTPSQAINQGPGAINRLGFFAEADLLVGFANGQALTEVHDSAYVFGNFGLFAEARDSDNFTAVFQDFALWFLQP